ncbi:MAG TPA: hypothetical protein VNO43_11750 [Candidatus Eisenbacteria bacterium]|nr:hypothetical protein [Candidatus Eisenbacteria bacterium]
MGSARFARLHDLKQDFGGGSVSDEGAIGLFEDDTTIGQEYDKVFRDRRLTPEEELIAAVLDEAIADFQRYRGGASRRSRKRFAEVERWIFTDDTEWIFSFVNCCEILGIKPDYLRQGLRRGKPEKTEPPIACRRPSQTKDQRQSSSSRNGSPLPYLGFGIFSPCPRTQPAAR